MKRTFETLAVVALLASAGAARAESTVPVKYEKGTAEQCERNGTVFLNICADTFVPDIVPSDTDTKEFKFAALVCVFGQKKFEQHCREGRAEPEPQGCDHIARVLQTYFDDACTRGVENLSDDDTGLPKKKRTNICLEGYRALYGKAMEICTKD